MLPVGGIKEKLLAAQAAGMARVLVPARNMPDVQVGRQPACASAPLPCPGRCRASWQPHSSIGSNSTQLLSKACAPPVRCIFVLCIGPAGRPCLGCGHSNPALVCPHCPPAVQAEVPAAVRQTLQVLPCQRLEDVLKGAFDPPLEPQTDLAAPQARL